MKLSHSSCQKYLQCGYKWKLHYKDRLRSTKIGSALIFGNAVDNALNRLLLDKKQNPDEDELEFMKETAEDIFKKALRFVNINGQDVDILEVDSVDYYKSDYAAHIVTEEDQAEITEHGHEHFTSLKRKGLMIIEAYRNEIMPQIEEVFEIQKKVSLPDGDDEFIGYIDVILSFVDEPGKKYVVDNKTSSVKYKEDSVRTSEQLAAYSEYAQIDHCAYIVCEKNIRKRTPQVRINIIKDNISDETIDKVFDTLSETFYNIENNKFEKNWDSCWDYGKKCDYFDYCRNGIAKNLVDLKKK